MIAVRARVGVTALCAGLFGALACGAPDAAPGSGRTAAGDTGSRSSGRQSSAAGSSTRGDPARGRALLTAFRDSLPSHSGNALRCTSCHLDEGKRPNGMPWFGTAAAYPKYRPRRGSIETLPQRINECIARSLAGKMLDEGTAEMRDMVAYIETLREVAKPAGPDTIRLGGDVALGAGVYRSSCARCHGRAGEGTVAPAVFGARSYSIGAGLARQKMLATFVHANMPYDSAGTLTPKQAADVAAYILAQPRQDYPGKERDWPKGDPPGDVAYATDAAAAAGKPLPQPRPVLPRLVDPRR